MISAPRLLALCALLAVAPLHAAEPDPKSAPGAGLAEDEVRALLDRNELAEWNRLADRRAEALRDLDKAKTIAQPPRVAFKGFQSETPEMRKAKADKLTQDANAVIAKCDKEQASLRAVAAERMKSSVLSAPCPVHPLPEAIKASAAEIALAAKDLRYDRLALAGVLLPSRGPAASDAALTGAFREAFEALSPKPAVSGAPAFSGSELKLPAARTAVVVAEVHSLGASVGALWTARLVDGKTFRVLAVSLAFVPVGKPAAGAVAPARYEVSFVDKRNFLGRLGLAEAWSFGAEGSGPGPALLRAALIARGTPEMNDYGTLATLLGGAGKDPFSKGFWVVEPTSDALRFTVGSRAAGRTGGMVPVGELTLAPVVEKPAVH